MRTRVLLVDDHEMMRDGLRALLSVAPDIEVVGEASTGQMGVDLAGSLEPDVVLMDVALPDISGIEATRQICAANNRTKVLALSTHTDKRYVRYMLDAGACGYVVKVTAFTELLRAVRAACGGVIYLSPEIAAS